MLSPPTLIYFVAAKCDSDDVWFRKFKKKIFHEALGQMLQSLKSGMEKPEVVRCPDGHHRRAIYGIGPYITDYPEQVLLACIVQNWCGRWVDLNWIDLYIPNGLLRCTAFPNNLDEGGAPRSRDLADALREAFSNAALWDEWGMDADIKV